MFTGHIGIALGAAADRSAPLWLLGLAAIGPDVVEIGLRFGGVADRWLIDVWSHSWLFVTVGAAAVALVARVLGAVKSWRGSLVTLAVYQSHWPADFITGLKPTWPGGPVVGLRLYRDAAWDLALEVCLVAGGWLLYSARAARPVSRGRALLSFAALLALLFTQVGVYDYLVHM